MYVYIHRGFISPSTYSLWDLDVYIDEIIILALVAY